MNNSKTIQLYSFALLFIAYFSQGILYPAQTIAGKALLLIILVWGGYCFFCELFIKRKPRVVYAMILFTLLLTLTYLVSPKEVIGIKYEAIGLISTFNQFKDAISFCLMFFIGYKIGKSNRPESNAFTYLSIGLTILCILRFFTLAKLAGMSDGGRATTINEAYNFVSLLPIYALALRHNRIPILALIFACIFFVILGAKRGAIICLALCFLYTIFWIKRNIKLNVFQRIGIVALIIVCISFASYQFFQNEYLQKRLEHTEKKGIGMREIGYKTMWNHWCDDDNMATKLFGNGTAQTITVWGNYGHNDWLELLIDNGLLGVLLYIYVFTSAYIYVFKKIKNPYLKLAAALCIIAWSGRTIFSMGYTALFSGISTFVLGYCISSNQLTVQSRRKNTRINESIVTY